MIMALYRGDEVFISPESWAETVPVLIDLADHPDDVATSTDNGFQLRIPAYLAERYERYQSLNTGTPPAPAPKKRGRPRKSTSPDEE